MFSDHHEIKLETVTEKWMKNVFEYSPEQVY